MATRLVQRFRGAMMCWMAKFMPSCKEISQLVSASMDTKLPLRKRLSIRLHVLMCGLCRRYEKQLRLLRDGCSRYASPDENAVEEPLSPEAMARLKAALDRRRK
ncbi:MAG: zf-HC2 domain-containing protein [Verrucomicrobia bacterium]|nr:zf-HC2 domain-containing protein [Verrucomicrobiota bacterium]